MILRGDFRHHLSNRIPLLYSIHRLRFDSFVKVVCSTRIGSMFRLTWCWPVPPPGTSYWGTAGWRTSFWCRAEGRPGHPPRACACSHIASTYNEKKAQCLHQSLKSPKSFVIARCDVTISTLISALLICVCLSECIDIFCILDWFCIF